MADAIGWPYQKLVRRLQTGTLRAAKVGDRWFFTDEQESGGASLDVEIHAAAPSQSYASAG